MWSYTAVTPQNEEQLDQLIHVNWWIMTRELSWILASMHWNLTKSAPCVFHERSRRETERTPYASVLGPIEPIWGWCFLNCIITGDRRFHHYKPGSKHKSMDVNFTLKTKFKMQPSVNNELCTVLWVGKVVILLDFLELGQIINSESYVSVLFSALCFCTFSLWASF